MTYYAGDAISDSVFVADGAGLPSALPASTVFSTAVVTQPNGSTLVPTIGSTGQAGLYSVTFPTVSSDPGTWTVLLISGETNVPYLASYDVDPAVTDQATAPIGTPSYSLADVRMMAAIELRDGIILEATSDGSQTGFIDSLNLTDSPDQYRSSHAIVISATNVANVGRIVRVDASSPTGSSLTFMGSGLPAITKAGDIIHLVNLGGNGFRPQMYDQVIANAIRRCWPSFAIETVVAGSAVFADDSPTIAIPAPLEAVYAVEFAEDDEEWRSMPPTRQAGRWGSGWSLDRPNRALRIDGGWRDEIDGLTYRLRGYARHAVPSANNDPIVVDLTWLLMTVKAQLASRRGTDRTWQQWAVEWGRLAVEAEGRMSTPLQPDTEFL